MKTCPYCAEEIQDAAIKCRYCGSMLNEKVLTPVEISGGPPSDLDREIKHLLDRGKFLDAVKLLREKKPTIDLGSSVAYVKAVGRGEDPEHAAAEALAKSSRPLSKGERVIYALRVSLAILLVSGLLLLLTGVIPTPGASNQTSTPSSRAAEAVQPSAPAPAATMAAKQDAAVAEGFRTAVAEMVKQGFIRRMNLNSGEIYISGELWEGFELDQKEKLVKIISGYREAEYKGLPQVTLYESRSGKELANYGAFTGVTIR